MAEHWHIGRVPRTPHVVAAKITESIVRHRLEEGTLLPPEDALAKEVGVSRMALREGLRILETQGLVDVRPGRNGGIVVLRPSHRAATRDLTILLQYEGATLDDVLLARRAIESESVRLAAQVATAEDVHAIGQVIEDAREQPHVWDDLAIDFHLEIARASHNPVLFVLMQSLRELLYSASPRKEISPERQHETDCAHERILEAIKDGDADQAERRMLRHMDALRNYLCELYQQDVAEVSIEPRPASFM